MLTVLGFYTDDSVGNQGTPISYISPKTGKQYVVISVGGARPVTRSWRLCDCL